MLPDTVRGFHSDDESKDVWLTCEADGIAIGSCYAAPGVPTEGSWNMLSNPVLPEKLASGAGDAMVKELEAILREGGHGVLIADTSGTDDFVQIRAFHRKNTFLEEARIRDFCVEGDDKVTFKKSLK